MSLEGWIFMVGLRVFDVGGLIVWLVWFFKLRDDDDGEDDDERGGNDPVAPDVPGSGPGGGLPLPDAQPWPRRRRDHGGDRDPAPTRPTRRPAPEPAHERPGRPERPPRRV